MKQLGSIACLVFAACGGGGGGSPQVDGNTPGSDAPAVDAAVDAAPEPTPAFVADGFITGQIAVDDAGMRDTFIVNGQTVPSHIDLSLTEQGASTSCRFIIAPAFIKLDTISTSTRFVKSVQYDVATSLVLLDECHWDDAYVLAEIKNQWGLAEVGWAQARFAEDRPNLDVIIDAEKPFGDTDTITRVAGGVGFAMADDGTVDGATLIEPAQGTLIRGLYQF